MALTYGFFNSVNHDRKYDAIQFGQIFDGIITDGVYGTYLKGMMVIASDNANEVIIQPGRAWFNHTWSYNDANLPFAAPEPEVLLDRVDTLVLDVNLEQAERQNKYLWIQGEPSSQNPQAPSLIRSVTHNQYPLCDVYRKAGTTMIYTADITNRVGTSDCPFVTGVLEGIDLDAWINQWDDEFHRWEDTTKNNFEVWMFNQQSVYTTWFNAIKDQMDTDLDEFEAWFETIKDIIDESAALHLQEEIDELRAMLPAGSHITVTTQNSELFNRNVTITDGIHEATARFDAGGSAVFESYPYVGNLTITSSDGIQTASSILNVPYFGRYSCEISFWKATVNINGGLELAGYQVTIKNSSDIVVDVISLNSEGEGVWYAMSPDTYKFSVTYGGETMEVSLNVTQETTYTVEIHGGFNYNGWLNAGDVSGTYASLDEVLADEKAVRKLMTKHASVDYLASFTASDTSVVTILNNDYAAKWITLRAYAEDTLTAAYSALMESIGKYGYGEWALMGQVPKMTSDTAPYGTAFASSERQAAYLAFDGNNTTFAANTPDALPYTLGYTFTTPCVIKEVHITPYYDPSYGVYVKDFKVQASNDGFASDINDLYSGSFSSTETAKTIELSNTTAYTSYRLNVSSTYISGGYVSVSSLQFYAWQPKGNVPIMTANNAPYGEASASGVNGSYYAYHAFDGDDSTFWCSNTTGTGTIQYKFSSPVCCKKFKIAPRIYSSNLCVKSFTVHGSNDGTTWSSALGTFTLNNSSTFAEYSFPLTNNDNYLYYQVNITDVYGNNIQPCVITLQFYGRELSESVPKMTSNTAPYGEVISDDLSVNPYKAFDGDSSTYGNGGNTVNTSYIGYKFTEKKNVKRIMGKVGIAYYQSWTMTGKFQYSVDGTTWVDIEDGSVNTSGSGDPPTAFTPIDCNINCIAIRILLTSGSVANRIGANDLQFFGFDYGEYDWDQDNPRHYIYDHGVELESLGSPITYGSPTVEKKPYEILGGTNSGSNGYAFAPESVIDITPYNLMRATAGDQAQATSNFGIKLARSYGAGDLSLISALNITTPISVNLGLDVSNVNQSAYPILAQATSSGAITRMSLTEWWLE